MLLSLRTHTHRWFPYIHMTRRVATHARNWIGDKCSFRIVNERSYGKYTYIIHQFAFNVHIENIRVCVSRQYRERLSKIKEKKSIKENRIGSNTSPTLDLFHFQQPIFSSNVVGIHQILCWQMIFEDLNIEIEYEWKKNTRRTW